VPEAVLAGVTGADHSSLTHANALGNTVPLILHAYITELIG
jgi:hypothetical protein